jgi:hypothetical protein
MEYEYKSEWDFFANEGAMKEEEEERWGSEENSFGGVDLGDWKASRLEVLGSMRKAQFAGSQLGPSRAFVFFFMPHEIPQKMPRY